MKRMLIIGLILAALLVAGCGAPAETSEPVKQPSLTQTVLEQAPAIQQEESVATEMLRITGNKIDPELIEAKAGTTLELTLKSDREIYMAFPSFNIDEKLVAQTPVTLRLPLKEKGTFEFYCIKGCDVPAVGQIMVR